MNQKKNGQPPAHGANQLHCQQTCQPHKPGVMQPKMAMAAQIKQPPPAPAAYRPQPVPKVLPGKLAALKPTANQTLRQPAISSGHNSPQRSKIMQPKTAGRLRQTGIIQCQMGLAEEQKIRQWVANYADIYLSDSRADMITDAPLSNAVRFRWFNLTLDGTQYTVGLNIHYGGIFGGLWVINKVTQESMEFHPHANPQHGLPMSLITRLKANHTIGAGANLMALI